MVRVAGIEPASPSAADFKSAVFTYFTTLAYWCSNQELNLELILTKNVLYHLTIGAYLAPGVGFEPTFSVE